LCDTEARTAQGRNQEQNMQHRNSRRWAAALVGALAILGLSGQPWPGAGQARAEAGPPPFPVFSHRTVRPPAPGQAPRITVQIATPGAVLPAAPAGPAAPGAPGAPGAAEETFAWFWSVVGAERAASGPGRLGQAVERLARPPAGEGVPAPRLQALQQLAAAHGLEILRATVGTEVSPALVLAIMAIESSGRPDAVSRAGAQGLMQLMPATAARFGVADAFAPAENIAGGVAYLDWLMDHFDRDPILVLAGYNAGEGAVRDHGGVPPFAETRAYVPKVLAAWTVARGLCRTPPELITDGCVFVAGSDG
jgi:soluble lytic murein transglycosylase-like protein